MGSWKAENSFMPVLTKLLRIALMAIRSFVLFMMCRIAHRLRTIPDSRPTHLLDGAAGCCNSMQTAR
jgi:hypothetical protein